jgi:ferritin
MISKKLQDALNAQINAEMWSAYLYLSMSVEAESKGLKGFGNWFFIQFREEQDHARTYPSHNSRTRLVQLLPLP